MSQLPLRSIASALVFTCLLGCDPSDAASPDSPPARAAELPRTTAAARGPADSPQVDDVIAALKTYEGAILASDTVTLKKIWADEYMFINAQGTIATRAQRLANFASGATNVVEAVNQREIVVHVYGDAAVTFQRFTLRGRFGGVETNTEVRGSFTWLKRAGRWQLISNQVIPVL